ncbi:30S ribosomal protein S13 [Candidatus Woesearchaeota archaeon]|nr:30S ribosomal protein S13 [Candidatus Woesearchaeota archaeon]
MEEEKGFKYIVRIANVDLDGKKPIGHAMRKIKGVGFMFSHMVCYLAGVDRTKRTGMLMDAEIKKLSEVALHPEQFHAPFWMFNRRKDSITGEDHHLITDQLHFVQDNDVKMLKKMRSYRGLRHAWGLPVRGQRTRSNFRRNKGKASLGVHRSKVAKAAAAPEKDAKKGK